MWPVSYQGEWAISSHQNFLFYVDLVQNMINIILLLQVKYVLVTDFIYWLQYAFHVSVLYLQRFTC
jgi:hypothetical protein